VEARQGVRPSATNQLARGDALRKFLDAHGAHDRVAQRAVRRAVEVDVDPDPGADTVGAAARGSAVPLERRSPCLKVSPVEVSRVPGAWPPGARVASSGAVYSVGSSSGRVGGDWVKHDGGGFCLSHTRGEGGFGGLSGGADPHPGPEGCWVPMPA
jgi:hypothetical protein